MQRMALEAAKWQPLPSVHHQILEGLVLAMFEFFSTGTSEFMMGKSRMDQLHKWCFSGFQWDLNLPWGFSPSFLMFFDVFCTSGYHPPGPWRPTALQSSRGSGTIRRPGTRPEQALAPPNRESQRREIQIPNLVGGFNLQGGAPVR